MAINDPILLDLPMPIRTPRLLIRPVQAGDGIAITEAFKESVKELRCWLPWARGNALTPTEAEILVRRFYADFILRQALHLGVFSSTQLIGMCGLKNFRWDIPSCELGYWFRTAIHRKGYATEAVNALTKYIFSQIGIRRLVIICDEENTRSYAIAERLGFTLEMKAKGIVPPGPNTDELRLGRLYSRMSLENLPELNVEW